MPQPKTRIRLEAIMQRIVVFALVIVAAFTMAKYATPYQLAPEEAKRGLFSVLEVGQTVQLENKGDVYVITVNPRFVSQAAVVVQEFGDDYVVFEDRSRVVQQRIPVWAVREVVVRKTGVRSESPIDRE
jgi:hypothetical protein